MTPNRPAPPPSEHYRNSFTWLAGLVRSTLRPRLRGLMWKWLERFVVIPEETGSPNPGPYRTSLFPPFRGLYELVQRPGVHFFTFCASARVGKTLFSICVLLWWIAERFGPVVWLDPTRKSAIKFVRTELEPFLQQCSPVMAIAIVGRMTWTTLEKYFRGKFLRIIGSGAEADLHGFQACLAILNECDRLRAALDRDASSADKIIARTRQFAHTRLILRNSTPTEELGDSWQNFLLGSQHHCYLPCPHCTSAAHDALQYGRELPATAYRLGSNGQLCDSSRVGALVAGMQRLNFFPESKEVPFDELGRLLPAGETRTEKTGEIDFSSFAIMQDRPRLDDPTQTESVRVGWDLDAVETGAMYKCAHCGELIDWTELNGMLVDYEWRAHNLKAARDKISAHLWAAYSPFEFWGIVAKEFLESKGNLGRLIKFWTLTRGLPFVREGTAIKEDDLDRVIKRTPVPYAQGQLPLEPEILTMTVDVQGEQFWWGIRAWGILWDHPDRPTWSALVDWGEAVSWTQIEEMAGLTEMKDGRLRRFTFTRRDGSVREYQVTRGLVDSGFEAETNKKVYEFCAKWSAIFSPYKGGDQSKTRGATVRLSPIMDDTLDIVTTPTAFPLFSFAPCIHAGFRAVGESAMLLIAWLQSSILHRKTATVATAQNRPRKAQRARRHHGQRARAELAKLPSRYALAASSSRRSRKVGIAMTFTTARLRAPGKRRVLVARLAARKACICSTLSSGQRKRIQSPIWFGVVA